MKKNIVQLNIVQLKAEGKRLRKEAETAFDMAAHYAPAIIIGEGESFLREAREADAVYRERRDELYEKWRDAR